MINVEKWNEDNEEQNIATCDALINCVRSECISKDDYRLMVEFLLKLYHDITD